MILSASFVKCLMNVDILTFETFTAMCIVIQMGIRVPHKECSL